MDVGAEGWIEGKKDGWKDRRINGGSEGWMERRKDG